MFDRIKQIFNNEKSQNTGANYGVNVSVEELMNQKEFCGNIQKSSHKIKSVTSRSGEYKSPFKGRGMEFEEVRLYNQGDDIRAIDWRVTARTGKPHTKLFQEEKERPVYILTDMRNTMRFSTKNEFKSVMAAKISSIIGWNSLKNGDKIGGIVISPNNYVKLSPQKQRKRLLAYFTALANASKDSHNQDKYKLSHALAELRRVVKSGALVYVLSDFYDFDKEAQRQLSHISKHNDCAMIYVHDLIEDKAPPAGIYRVSDGNNISTINTADKKWCEEYNSFFAEKYENLKNYAMLRKIKFIKIRTDEEVKDLFQSANKSL